MKIFEPEIAFKFIGGFFLAMSLIHFVLYMYNRHRKANLIYSLGLFMAFINYALVPLKTEPTYTNDSEKANIILSTITNGTLLYFISYYLLSARISSAKSIIKRLVIVYAVGFVLLTFSDYGSLLFNAVTYATKAFVYALVVLVCIIGLVKKIKYFRLIVAAAVLLSITEVIFASDFLGVWNNHYPPTRVLLIILGYTLPFFTYTAYISIDFANTSRELLKEHMLNEQLTREKYEQEIATRKLLEAQNIELENKIKARTQEILQQKEELEIQSEKIKELDKIKSRFFANISHEFRTPLTLILGPVKKKLLASVDSNEQRDLKVIYQNANRLLQLVNQLLDLTKIESGNVALTVKRTNLNQFIRRAADAFHSMADIKEISLRIETNNDIVEIFADHEKLDKVINNLLANAFKFTPAGGQVSISVAVHSASAKFSDGYVSIEVKDNGIGIEHEHLDKIFDRFYQADNSTTRTFEGTGIGLALTKELVEMHEGIIEVKSEPGLGSIFTIKLPIGKDHFNPANAIVIEDENVVESEEVKNLADEIFSNIQRHGNNAVLIVEDNLDLRNYMKENLQLHYDILEASNGEEGYAMAIKEIPDLIISDVMMPRMDGMQLCKQLKSDEKTSHIPLILLTAKADGKSKIDGFDLGADDYIPKPFDIDELKARARNLIENRKKLQEKFTRQILLKPSEIKVESMDDKFIKRSKEIIEQHLSDTTFGVEDFAKEALMSVAQLYRKLNALTGFTPNELIRNTRLDYAAQLLRQKSGNVADVAYQSGFNNLSYFSKCFKEKFGCSPSEYNRVDSIKTAN